MKNVIGFVAKEDRRAAETTSLKPAKPLLNSNLKYSNLDFEKVMKKYRLHGHNVNVLRDPYLHIMQANYDT